MVSLPLGILASRRPKLAEGVLSVAGVIQTVPTLAMLALMVLLLQGRIGFRPSCLALTLYSLLPIVANTVPAFAGWTRRGSRPRAAWACVLAKCCSASSCRWRLR